MDLKFDVTEPEAAKVSGTDDKTQIWNTTRTDTRTDIRTDVKTDTNYTTSTKVTTVEEVNTKVYATITVTEVIEEDSKTERAWESSWTKTYTYDDPEYPIELYNDEYPIPEKKNPADENLLTELIDEEIPLAGLPEEELVVLFDEMVPLASIPRTGETSVPWLALSLLSVSGLLGLYLTDKMKKA